VSNTPAAAPTNTPAPASASVLVDDIMWYIDKYSEGGGIFNGQGTSTTGMLLGLGSSSQAGYTP
jgi:hypothetical protein